MRALGEAVTRLPWLSPCAASLLALARLPAAAAWAELRRDPAAVLLVVRQAAGTLAAGSVSFYPALLRDPAVLDGALQILETDKVPGTRKRTGAGFVDWNRRELRPIYHASLSHACLAELIAGTTGRADPENAWVAGLLAGLGWHAVCAADPELVLACHRDQQFAQQPSAVQQRHWGIDQAGIARRLLRRWQLPSWLAAVVGHLGLPAEVALSFGAEPDLFRIVQLALSLCQQADAGLRLSVGTATAPLAAALDLSANELADLEREAAALVHEPVSTEPWDDPASVPLLPDLLRLAADNLRLRNAPTLETLEGQFDQLHRTLEEQHAAAAGRLQAQKLQALAEFAAGAGHEINNPLAVISGQAQYLLKQCQKTGDRSQKNEESAASPVSCFPAPDFPDSLGTIIGQTQRIHHLLNEVMQFARPPRPHKQLIDVGELVRDVSAAVGALAEQRRVRLVCPEPRQPVTLYADAKQVRTALTCLLRNAVEAAPSDGWAGVRTEMPAANRLDFVIEDSGPGPLPAQKAHLFDPFYSGRQAGRGRGLGLPTAWRLAREHGGDVRFDDVSGGPTRFVLSLPAEAIAATNGVPASVPA